MKQEIDLKIIIDKLNELIHSYNCVVNFVFRDVSRVDSNKECREYLKVESIKIDDSENKI